MNDATWPYRFAAGVSIFFVLGVLDLIQHPENPKRLKEYLFLLATTLAAAAYGVLHDRVTYAISPDYYVLGKGIASAAEGFNLDVVVLAIKATWWAGLLGGALILIANNEDRAGRHLPYGTLFRIALAPLACSVLLEWGTAAGCAVFGTELAAALGSGEVRESLGASFFVVWGMHFGAYVGGAVGLLAALLLILRGKKRRGR